MNADAYWARLLKLDVLENGLGLRLSPLRPTRPCAESPDPRIAANRASAADLKPTQRPQAAGDILI
jgi:hypothetical protein